MLTQRKRPDHCTLVSTASTIKSTTCLILPNRASVPASPGGAVPSLHNPLKTASHRPSYSSAWLRQCAASSARRARSSDSETSDMTLADKEVVEGSSGSRPAYKWSQSAAKKE